MKPVIHPHRALRGLALAMAGLFSLQPFPLRAPEARPSLTIAADAPSVDVLVRGFWETVALYAGR